MIKRYTGAMLLSNPPQMSWNWWCGCGHKEFGGTEISMFSKEDIFMFEWKRLNKIE